MVDIVGAEPCSEEFPEEVELLVSTGDRPYRLPAGLFLFQSLGTRFRASSQVASTRVPFFRTSGVVRRLSLLTN
jgi:hypothetical protein